MTAFFLKSRAHLLIAVATISSLLVAAPLGGQSAEAARAKATKYGVCHRTNAIKNPYRFITVAWSSVDGNGTGHDNPVHDGPVFNVASPVASHGTTPRDSGLGTEAGGSNNRWGDIFNASRGSGNGNNNSNNWTTAGQAIFNGATFTLNGVTKAACRQMSVNEYIASEREENPNKPMSDIMAELDDMEASEDVALKQSLGGATGTFTSWFASCNRATTDCENTTVITTQIAAKSPSVTTEPPTAISNGTSTSAESATLNGTLSPLGVSMTWYFEFDDDADFTAGAGDTTEVQEVPGTPGSSTSNSTVPVSFNATGLNSTKTYYYRTVGVATSGSADTLVETYLYGVTKQFVFGAPSAPTITGITCSSQALSVAFTAGNANGGTITNYEYSTDGGATYTAVSPSATTSPIAISGLVNGTDYSVVIRARTSSKTGVDSVAMTGTPCGTPSSTTTAATNVQPTTATLNGHLTGNGTPLATIQFTWGLSPTLASSNTITAANTVSLAGNASAYPVIANITGLTGGTTYYFEVSGTYASGASTTQGGILSFVTPANVVPPTTTTQAATSVTETTATINGDGTSNGASSTLTFTWGTSPTLASGNTTVTPSQSPLAPTASNSPASANLTGLTGGTTYYFRITISNTNGTVNGSILQFTTPLPPTTTTQAATSVTETTATINGNGTSNGASSTLTFTWGTSPTLASGNTTVTPSQSPLASNATNSPASANLTGLTGGTTYYFRITISNTNGTVNGAILQFTTPAAATTTTTPQVTTTSSTVPSVPVAPLSPSTTAPDSELGRVIGTAWFDINQNDKKDANEPFLAGVDVEVRPRAVSAQSAGRVRATALTVKTTSTGAFDFSDLAPGVYQIKSVLPSGYGIEQSWDSSGNADWSVTVTVVARKTSRGDFAAIGNVATSGCVTGSPANSTLDANWAGFDGVLGTSDDASFGTDLGADCEFVLNGLPTGGYKVEAKTSTGKVFASSALRFSNKSSVFKSGAISVTTRIVRVLPATGSQSMQDWLAVALVLLAGGGGVSMTNRRRRRV